MHPMCYGPAMSRNRVVWSDEHGDLRKKDGSRLDVAVDEKTIVLQVRRLTSGKGRTVIEIKGLPQNKEWSQNLAKKLKKSLGAGGTYKNGAIEIHGEKIELVTKILDSQSIKWKKTGG